MKKNYKAIRANLSKVRFDYNEVILVEKTNLSVNSFDKIFIEEIRDNEIVLRISRQLEVLSTIIETECIVNVATDKLITKDEFCKDVRDGGIQLLNVAFSKISLTISNVTSHSAIGALITPPIYNFKQIEIE